MTEQHNLEERGYLAAKREIINSLVIALELKTTNNGSPWSFSALIDIVDRQRRNYKSLHNKDYARFTRLVEILNVRDESDWDDLLALIENIVQDKDIPPTLSSLLALHDSNYQEIAYALGVPGSEFGKTFSVQELVQYIRSYVESTNDICSQMTRRAEEAEARLAEDSQGWEERVASRAELVERIKTLESELASTRDELELTKANEGIARDNMVTSMQVHERVEGELREDLELQAARNLVRALEAERQLREMAEALEIAEAEAHLAANRMLPEVEERAKKILEAYDELTLALSYKWGDAKKEKFLRDLENTTLMSELEAKYRKRMKRARKAGNA